MATHAFLCFVKRILTSHQSNGCNHNTDVQPDLGHWNDDLVLGRQRFASSVGPHWRRRRGGVKVRIAVFVACLLVAGCGVDGAPEPKASGVDVSGTAKIGVRGSL